MTHCESIPVVLAPHNPPRSPPSVFHPSLSRITSISYCILFGQLYYPISSLPHLLAAIPRREPLCPVPRYNQTAPWAREDKGSNEGPCAKVVNTGIQCGGGVLLNRAWCLLGGTSHQH